MSTIETIRITKDGSKLLRYNGIEFWTNSDGGIMSTNNWNVVDQLVAAGLATSKFYRELYGYTEYTLTA